MAESGAGMVTGKDGLAERLAAQLRENLKRRKEQARGQAGDKPAEPREPE